MRSWRARSVTTISESSERASRVEILSLALASAASARASASSACLRASEMPPSLSHCCFARARRPLIRASNSSWLLSVCGNSMLGSASFYAGQCRRLWFWASCALYLGQLLGYPLLGPIRMELAHDLLRGDGVRRAQRRHLLSILDTVAGHTITQLYVWKKRL